MEKNDILKELNELKQKVHDYGRKLEDMEEDWRYDGMTEEVVGIGAAIKLFEKLGLDRV